MFLPVSVRIPMGKRGLNAFKSNDAVRAIESARKAGVEPAMVEIVAKDGTTFRIYGDRAVTIPANSEPGISREWREAIDELKKQK
jgi:hypothetical protein